MATMIAEELAEGSCPAWCEIDHQEFPNEQGHVREATFGLDGAVWARRDAEGRGSTWLVLGGNHYRLGADEAFDLMRLLDQPERARGVLVRGLLEGDGLALASLGAS